MTTLIVVGVQRIAGRKNEAVRLFCLREEDQKSRLVEVSVKLNDADDVTRAKRGGEPVTVEVPDHAWSYVLSTKGVDVAWTR